MAEEKQVFQRPLNHNVSTKTLQFLIDGYIRNVMKERTMQQVMQQIIPTTINQLFTMYYPKQMHMIIVNQTNLKLTLCDAESENIKLTSNDIIPLNDKKEELDVGATRNVGICYKQNINIDNTNYNVIFKTGNDNTCRVIMYPTHIEPDNFNAYYYKLPPLPKIPFRIECCDYNNPVYSQEYGLLLFGTNSRNEAGAFGKIANLKLNFNDLSLKSLDSFEAVKDSLKWNVEKVPKDIALKYTHPPNYCFINEHELFIINGADENNIARKEVSIYNLETKECKILKQNSVYASALGGIAYSSHNNKVFVGDGYSTYYYDLYKDEEPIRLRHTNNDHRRPRMWFNNNETILNIASITGNNVFYEQLDLRSLSKSDGSISCVGWTNIHKLNQLTRNIWGEPCPPLDTFLSIVQTYSY